MEKIKGFRDLCFEWQDGVNGRLTGIVQAIQFFPNGYGVSVVRGGYTYSGEGTYEVAILKGTEDKWGITYDTPLADDVLPYRTPSEISEIMKQIQLFEPNQY